MGGGKSGSTGTQQQTSTVSIPPEVLARYNSVNASAQNVAQAPFQSYSGEFVAPINATQQGGINQIADADKWINPTWTNQVGSISSGIAGAQPYYGLAGGNIGSGLAGGQAANQAALGQYGAALGAAQPYNVGAADLYGGAAGLAGAGTAAVNPTAVDSSAIGQYMSPYNNAVVQSTMALLGQQQAQQQNQLKTQQILGGSFGGDRSGIDRAVLSGQQNLASGNVISNLMNQNYSQALGAAQQQQGVGLGAAQANRAALQTGANQFTGLGQATAGLGQQVYGQGTGQAQFTGQIGQQGYGQALGAAQAQQGLGQTIFNTGLGAAQGYGAAGAQALQGQLAQGQAQLGAGTVQQQTTQADLQARYNQFLQQQAYPFQTTQFMANIAEGTGALSGSSTNANNYSPQPFFSDRRLKENIKTIAHTKAGIPIVQYNYKGRPGTQIGLIAQDVEKHRPEAVGLAHGYKTVDYERALRAGGGGVGLAGGGPAMVIYHIGGSVDEDDAGRGFGTGYADGGSPGMDPVAMAQMLAAHQAMYPGAAGRMGMDSGPRGVQLHQPSGRSLMKADLIKPQEQQSQTRNAAQGLGDVAGAGKSAAAIYDMGKDAAVGSAAKGTPGTSGYTPATGGLVGTGGQWSPESGWFGKTAAGLGAANSNTPSSSSITAQPLPDITPPAAVDASTIADASSGLVDDALSTAWAWRGGRQKRYASGGMPYGDAGDGYIPDDLYEPINAADLAKEQKGMESKTPDLNSGSSKSKSSTGKTAGSLAGGLAGMYFGPAGSIVGSGLGGLLGGALDNKRGGRIGYQEGGGPTDDNTPRIDWDKVIPKEPGLNPERPAARDNVIPFPSREEPRSGLNPERPAVRDYQEPEWAKKPEIAPEDFAPTSTAGVVPMPAAGVVPPVPSATPTTPTPGLAPPARASEPPGFRSPGMQTMPAPPGDQFSRMLQQESGTSQFYPAGHEKAGQPVTSPKGATGIAQVMPGTGPEAAKLAGVPWDPALFSRPATGDPKLDDEAKQYNLKLGRAYYDEQLRTFGDPNIASAAYNAGPGAVQNALQQAKATGRDYLSFLPKETQDYVRIVSGRGGGGTMTLYGGPTPGLGGGTGSTGLGAPKDFLDRAGDWYDRNEKRIVPALAFLGSMLSSPSRTLAGSIGSGLVGGAQALQTQQQLGQGQQRIGITQNAQFISVLAQLRQMQSARAQRGLPPDPVLDGQVHAIMDKIAQSGNVAPATSATMGLPSEGGATPVNQPAGGGPGPAPAPATLPAGPAPTPLKSGPAPAPAEPASAATKWGPMPSLNLAPVRNQIDPDWDPQELQKRADQTAALGDAAGAARLQERAAAAQARMESAGTLPGKNGGSVSIPGFTERQIAQQNVAENQKTLQTENAAATTRQTARMQLGAIKELLQSYESGTAADVQAEAQGVANLVGIKLPVGDTMNAQKFQEFVKNAYGIILSNASLNKNETDQLRGMVDKTFASPTMQPGANRKILAETEAGMNLADKRNQDFTRDVAGANHLSPSQWSNEWRARPENQLEPMVEKARKETPVMGDVPAKRQDLEEGVQYILRPTEAIKLFAGQKKSNGEPLTADDIKKQFGDKKRIRVVIQNGVPMPVGH